MSSGRKGAWIFIFAVIALLYLGSDGVEFMVDYAWFESMDRLGVFRTIFLAQLGVGFAFGTAVFLFLLVNLIYALRQIGDPAEFLPQEILITPLGRFLTGRFLLRGALLFALGAGALAGLAAASDWESPLLYFAGGSFGQVEPVFQRDAGFYVFQLPMLERLQSLAWVLGIVALFGVGFLYFLRLQGELPSPFRRNMRMIQMTGLPPRARLHLALLAGWLLIALAVGQHLDRYVELYRPGGLFTGPGYAEIHGTIPMLALKSATALLAVVLVTFGLLGQRQRFVIGALGLLAVVWIGAGLYTAALQRFVVNPNESSKEEPYLVHHIRATNLAFGLDTVTERSLDGERLLSMADIEANGPTIRNIRLWDHEPLLDTFAQIQEIRTYYDFVSVDNDRYLLDGELRQTMLSPRELQKASLPSRTWVNERMTFTHGYGITMGPVNRVNEQGLPVLLVKNIPPSTELGELQVTRPEIYFGEVVDDYVFVKTLQPEFDYPEGDRNIFKSYEGTGGMPLGSFWRRLLLAAYLRDIKLLLAEDFTEETRILLIRNVMRRTAKIAPFFRYDQDPYLVIDQGRLLWILDAYTLSERFPYSERIQGLGNYMRNPVKVVLDAYNGDVRFFLADPSDPIARAYGVLFPGLIEPMSAMPAGIRRHIRHPADYFRVQTHTYATYHMLEVNTFYNKEDQWEVPVVGQQRMEPYYTVMKLPEEDSKAEFILMLPFTPRLKDNLAAWMVARSDGEHLGKLVVYRFPKQKLIYGPRQMVARINQDPIVSQQITLWDQSGSNVIRGTLLVIPIESSLIYVQPLYLKAQDGRIPELKRVIVGYQNDIAMGLDLEDALGQIFAGKKPPRPVLEVLAPQARAPAAAAAPPGPVPGTPLTHQALEAYEAMEQASREGNWTRFGQELERLGRILRDLEGRSR
jgi:uncharacterized membrane protein (UPF0182 family)